MEDEIQKLMCTADGCTNRWSVKIDRPMCSKHQWGESVKVKTSLDAIVVKEPVKTWYTDDDSIL